MMRKYGLFLLIFSLAGLLAPLTCAAAAPLKIVILPVMNETRTHDADVEKVISEALHAKFRKPLNDIVPVYQVIPADQISAALPVAREGLSLKFKPEIMREMADKLHADVVIGAVITDLQERTLVNLAGDYLQESHLTIRLVVYNADTRAYRAQRRTENYFGEQMSSGDPDYLAQSIMDHMLPKLVVSPETFFNDQKTVN